MKTTFTERQLQSGETGTIAIVATSRTSAKAAASAARKKLGADAKIAVHYDPANYMFSQNWLAYRMPE